MAEPKKLIDILVEAQLAGVNSEVSEEYGRKGASHDFFVQSMFDVQVALRRQETELCLIKADHSIKNSMFNLGR